MCSCQFSARLPSHSVPVATDGALGERHNGDQLQDPLSAHRVSLRLDLSNWMNRSSPTDVETV